MSAASILKGSNRGFDWAIDGYDSQRVTECLVEMIGESAKMRILAACHGLIANGFCFPRYDPGLELLAELTVGDLGVDRWESHRLFTKVRKPDCLASSGCFVATEFVAHVNAQMMHDHCDAAGATAMWPEDGKERSVAVVGILGIVKESRLRPFATADVRFGRKLAHEPAIRRVNRDRLFLDILTLDQGFIAPLSQSPEVVIDVMFHMPVIPVQVTINPTIPPMGTVVED